MPRRPYLLQSGKVEYPDLPICTCDAPRLPEHIKRGVCGNCGGARGDDCKGLNKPIRSADSAEAKHD